MDENTNNTINIDTSSGVNNSSIGVGGRKGTVQSIMASRQAMQDYNSYMSGSLNSAMQDTADAFDQLSDNMETFKQIPANIAKDIGASTKELEKLASTLLSINTKLTDMFQKGNASQQEAIDLLTDAKTGLNDYKLLLSNINLVYDAQNKKAKEVTEETKRQIELNKKKIEDQKKADKEQAKELEKIRKEAGKSVTEAIAGGLDKLSNKLSSLKQMVDIDSIAKSLDRSTQSLVQEQLQISYGLNRSQFGQFKSDVYGTFNNGLYSSSEVLKVFEDLKEIGIGTREDANKYFSSLLKGQSLLGLQAETQAKLVTLSNITGKDVLTFTTNRVASYMKTATNLSKDQLNELISMNASLATEAAAAGIDGEVFNDSLNNATVALANLFQDPSIADSYRDAINSSINGSTEDIARLYGMNYEQLRDFYNNGGNLVELFENSTGYINNLYKQMTSSQAGYDSIMNNRSAYIESGVDASMLNLMSRFAQAELAGDDLSTLIELQAQSGTTQEELNELEQERNDSLGVVQQSLNSFSNWVMNTMDWVTMDTLKNSLSGITIMLSFISTILSTISSKITASSISGAASSLTGTAGTTGKLRGLKSVFSKAGLKTAAKVAAPLVAIEAAGNAFTGYNSTATEMYGENASVGQRIGGATVSVLSGSTVHRDSEGNVSTGANAGWGALSGAGTGATIGTLIAPGIGTAIGAVVGGVAGLIGGLVKGNKAKEQEKLQKEQLEAQQEIAENTSKANDLIVSQTTLVSRSTAALRPTNSGSADYPGHYSINSGFKEHMLNNSLLGIGSADVFDGSKGQEAGPWQVTSAYGWRTLNGARNFHKGIDLSRSGTQQIYAAAGGTVKLVSQGGAVDGNHGGIGVGPYGVNVITDDGLTYVYGHMKARYVSDGEEVTAGTHLGTMGNLGNSYGQHLHFQVNKNGAHTNPVPYITTSLWTGKVSGTSLYTEGTDSSVSDAIEEVSKVKFNSISQAGGVGSADTDLSSVVQGLAEIKSTLISLSNQQTQDEKIMSMLQGRKKPEPRTI